MFTPILNSLTGVSTKIFPIHLGVNDSLGDGTHAIAEMYRIPVMDENKNRADLFVTNYLPVLKYEEPLEGVEIIAILRISKVKITQAELTSYHEEVQSNNSGK